MKALTEREEEIMHLIYCLQKLWLSSPELSLCQLISNLHGSNLQDISFTRDGRLMNEIKEKIERGWGK